MTSPSVNAIASSQDSGKKQEPSSMVASGSKLMTAASAHPLHVSYSHVPSSSVALASKLHAPASVHPNSFWFRMPSPSVSVMHSSRPSHRQTHVIVRRGRRVVVASIRFRAALVQHEQRLFRTRLLNAVLDSPHKNLNAGLDRKVAARCHTGNQHLQVVTSQGICRPVVRGSCDVQGAIVNAQSGTQFRAGGRLTLLGNCPSSSVVSMPMVQNES